MGVVEKFLIEKLDEAIGKAESDNGLPMMFHVREECRKLKDMIEKQMPEDGSPVDSKLKEKLYYLNNILTEWKMLSKMDHLCTPKTLKERLKKIKQDLLNATKESETGDTKPDTEIYRWSCRDPEKMYGVEDEAKIVERLLFKEGFKAIGFVGMAGVGKTALCQNAFNNQQVKKHFHPRIWVCLSKLPKQPNVVDYRQELVKMMLMCLGFEKEIVDKVGQGGLNEKEIVDKVGQDGLKRLILALRRQLKRQRYLIVLDDVWNTDKGFNEFCSLLAQDDEKEDRLAYGLPKRHEGAVIVTSRSPIIMENMVGEKNFLSLPLVDKESCWEIFKDAVKKDGDEPTEEIQKLKNEIVKECAGLPLTAKMLGKIARSQANLRKMSNQSQNKEETHQQEA